MGLHPRATTPISLTCEQVSASHALRRAHVPILACGASSGASLSSGGAQNSFAHTCACVSRASQSMNPCVEDDLPVLLHPSHRHTAQRDRFPDAPRTRSQAPGRILSCGAAAIQGPYGDDQRPARQRGRPGAPLATGKATYSSEPQDNPRSARSWNARPGTRCCSACPMDTQPLKVKMPLSTSSQTCPIPCVCR